MGGFSLFLSFGGGFGKFGVETSQKWAEKKNLKTRFFAAKMMKKWPMFEKWASRCPNSAGIPREFRGIPRKGRFYTYANPKKKGHFPRKIVKKRHLLGGFSTRIPRNSAEFRGDFGKPPKSAKFGILALKLTEIRKLQLLRWIREEAGQCRLSVFSKPCNFPLKNHRFLQEGARISGKMQK